MQTHTGRATEFHDLPHPLHYLPLRKVELPSQEVHQEPNIGGSLDGHLTHGKDNDPASSPKNVDEEELEEERLLVVSCHQEDIDEVYEDCQSRRITSLSLNI